MKNDIKKIGNYPSPFVNDKVKETKEYGLSYFKKIENSHNCEYVKIEVKFNGNFSYFDNGLTDQKHFLHF